MGNASEIKRTLNRVSNMVANGELDPKRGNTIVLACNSILSAIKTVEQEKKIDELEKLLNEMGNNGP